MLVLVVLGSLAVAGDEGLCGRDLGTLTDVELQSCLYVIGQELERRKGQPSAPVAAAVPQHRYYEGKGGCVGAGGARTVIEVSLVTRTLRATLHRVTRAELNADRFRLWIDDDELAIRGSTPPQDAEGLWQATLTAPIPETVNFPLTFLLNDKANTNAYCELAFGEDGVGRVKK
jgi:hypothetical protein